MARRTSHVRIAVVSPVRTDSSYGSFVGVMDYKEHAAHWQLVGQVHNPVASLDEIDLGAVDGVIGFIRERRWAEIVSRAGVAAVNFSNALADLSLPRVGHDDIAIGRMGATHLLERGFTNFAFLGAGRMWYANSRLEGFRGVIEQMVGRRCDVLVNLPELPDHRPRIRDWLARLPKPVGIMTSSDSWGCQTIDTATKLGLRIPEDVAVLGVDNDRWLTHIMPTPMSSIEVDWRMVGYRAAQMLDDILAGKRPPPHWIPPLGVVARRSTDIFVTDDPVAEKALQFIRDHSDKPITVEDILAETGISRRTLETRLKRAIGQTPYTAICKARVARAKTMLVQSDATMAEIARACGFNRADQFFTIFKRLTGTTPGSHRRRIQNRSAEGASASW
jgi:LacI family transcriptional regulator